MTDPSRTLLRHFLGALAYRTQKALRGAPADFAEFRAGTNVRTPHELLADVQGKYQALIKKYEALAKKYEARVTERTASSRLSTWALLTSEAAVVMIRDGQIIASAIASWVGRCKYDTPTVTTVRAASAANTNM